MYIIIYPTLKPVNDVTEGSAQEALMGASLVLPRKVGRIVSISIQFSIVDNDGCFLENYHRAIMARNSCQICNFSSSHI